MQPFESHAIITASNISVFIILSISLIIIASIIKKRADRNLKRADRNLTPKDYIVNLFNSNALRIPFGFFILISGLLVRYAIRIPTNILTKKEDYETIRYIDDTFGPIVFTTSESAIYIGFCIIFWPTILQIMYKWFGPKYEPQFYTTTALIFLFIFKIILTICGLSLYWVFTSV